jgi:hypothetical protein
LKLETNEFENSNQILKKVICKIQKKIFQISFQNPISISSQFGFLGNSFVLAPIHARGGRRGKLGRLVSWSRTKKGPSQKNKWIAGKKKDKEEKGENERK